MIGAYWRVGVAVSRRCDRELSSAHDRHRSSTPSASCRFVVCLRLARVHVVAVVAAGVYVALCGYGAAGSLAQKADGSFLIDCLIPCLFPLTQGVLWGYTRYDGWPCCRRCHSAPSATSRASLCIFTVGRVDGVVLRVPPVSAYAVRRAASGVGCCWGFVPISHDGGVVSRPPHPPHRQRSSQQWPCHCVMFNIVFT